ncbi:rRNA pseudouridine synthase [Candidatus Kirkpatrickella diaphorinae]|uniref:Pseudouridine synthase n=1 Tax=Candidatus Kirkpatrickella diaphorinae TaxID=2984322 RepID=A0ABY6GII6_9PROT|nr:pseudouridine synthase [Candidatus Kirkpatrickella diaphorinae]UYH51319.1 rRNA pseudouridine synthase [Candidatus Kirkpatrickella diaphorinae]
MTDDVKGERIAKFLARAGVGSRRDVERMVAEGRIIVNNEVIQQPATFVTAQDMIRVDGAVIGPQERTRVWRYHKPTGLVTTHHDPQNRKTVFESLPPGLPRVISIGRLDLNSEGLLLLTNDGALARRLELPSHQWVRRYRVRVFGLVDEKRLAALAEGSVFDGVRYGAIQAGLDSRKGDNSWLTVSLQEGKNREIRRVMAALNLHVSRLIRVAYGPFQLGTLQKRALEEVPTKTLREQIGGFEAAPRRKAARSVAR